MQPDDSPQVPTQAIDNLGFLPPLVHLLQMAKASAACKRGSSSASILFSLEKAWHVVAVLGSSGKGNTLFFPRLENTAVGQVSWAVKDKLWWTVDTVQRQSRRTFDLTCIMRQVHFLTPQKGALQVSTSSKAADGPCD